MINKIFSNKLLVVFTILILLSFTFINSNVFAATYDLSDYSNYKNDVSWCIVYATESDNIYLITKNETNYKYLFASGLQVDEEGNYTSTGTFIACNSVASNNWGNQGQVRVYTFNKETNKFGNKTVYYPNTANFSCGNCQIIASGMNIYRIDNVSIFFQATPVPSQVVLPPEVVPEVIPETVEIPAVETVEQIPKAIVETLKIVIPVGLAVLAIGLIIYLIKRVIYSIR